MYNFNSPIGYSKRPLLYNQNVSTTIESNGSNGSIISDSQVSLASIESLSPDLIITISQYLNQSSKLSLLKSNKSLCNLLKPMLYHTIIIDRNYSAFNKSIDHSMGTFINSTYNFKQLLSNDNDSLIRHFQCLTLPDSILMFDQELESKLEVFFSKLSLAELVWLPDNFKLQFLHLLNHKQELIKLVINVKSDIYVSGVKLDVLTEFTHLEQFSLKPYTSGKFLQPVVSGLNTDNLSVFSVNKFDKELVEPKPRKLVVRTVQDLGYDVSEVRDLKYIFYKKFMNLHTLCLNGVIVCYQDCRFFENSINMDLITTLELRNMVEYNFGNDKSILIELQFPNLVNLALDVKQGYQDFVPIFLFNHRYVKKLDLTIRLNETFEFDESLYAMAVNHLRQLTELEIEIKQDKNLTHLNVPINLATFNYFRNMKLKFIKFNSNNHQHNLTLVKSLPTLQYLHVFGLKAGGSPNFALGTEHPNIFDEWFKVQHVALIYLQNNPGLRYIKINECVFECIKDRVVPVRS